MFYVLNGDYEKVVETSGYDLAIQIAVGLACEGRVKYRVVSLDGGDTWSEDEPFTTHLVVWAGEQP